MVHTYITQHLSFVPPLSLWFHSNDWQKPRHGRENAVAMVLKRDGCATLRRCAHHCTCNDATAPPPYTSTHLYRCGTRDLAGALPIFARAYHLNMPSRLALSRRQRAATLTLRVAARLYHPSLPPHLSSAGAWRRLRCLRACALHPHLACAACVWPGLYNAYDDPMRHHSNVHP